MSLAKTGKLTVLMGGQYGSEGKGVIAAHIAKEYDYHVRVGGPNAGHSFQIPQKDGFEWRTFKMQGLPCGWINPNATLVIGTGAIVDPDLLMRELKEAAEVDPTVYKRLVIDPMATVLDKRAHDAEGGVDGEIHARIGSTGEGVGAARHAKMSRNPANCLLARDIPELSPYLSGKPTGEILVEGLMSGGNVLIEGTQGSGLSLTHGPWPYATSTDTNACQMLADVGLPPRWVDEIIMVVRTYPIRVAGNSGPLKDEVDWDYISERMGKPTEEKTTVTHKIRRVGKWDPDLVSNAVRLNAPTSIALTFADYLDPSIEGRKDPTVLEDSDALDDFVLDLERLAMAPVDFIGTGGQGWQVVDLR